MIGNIAGNITRLEANLGAKTLFKRGLDVRTRPLSSEIRKKLIDEGIKHDTDLYRLGTSKIKNENVRKVLDSDIANYIVEETQKKSKANLTNLFGAM